jgi:hypothetical protein
MKLRSGLTVRSDCSVPDGQMRVMNLEPVPEAPQTFAGKVASLVEHDMRCVPWCRACRASKFNQAAGVRS